MWLLLAVALSFGFLCGFGLGVVVGVALSPRRPDPPAAPPAGTDPLVSFDELLAAVTHASDAYLAGVRPRSSQKGTDHDDESQTHPHL